MHKSHEDVYTVELVFSDQTMYASLDFLLTTKIVKYLEAINYENCRGPIVLDRYHSGAFENCVISGEIHDMEDAELADFMLIEKLKFDMDNVLRHPELLTLIDKFPKSIFRLIRSDKKYQLIAPETFGICADSDWDKLWAEELNWFIGNIIILAWIKGDISLFGNYEDNYGFWSIFNEMPEDKKELFESKTNLSKHYNPHRLDNLYCKIPK